MTTSKLLQDQLKESHKNLEGTMEGVEDSHLHYQPEGTAHNIAATYAHVIASEDLFINFILQGKPPFSTTSWEGKTGISEPMPGSESTNWEKDYKAWAERVRVDLSQLREYAKVVYESAENYVSNLRDIDLDREVDLSGMGMGQMSVGSILGNLVIGHINQIMGEISALKGIQGLKGYPF